MAKLEEDLKQVRNKAEEADKQYDEISKKLQITEGELEKAEERGENGEMKIMELEEELKVVIHRFFSPLFFVIHCFSSLFFVIHCFSSLFFVIHCFSSLFIVFHC